MPRLSGVLLVLAVSGCSLLSPGEENSLARETAAQAVAPVLARMAPGVPTERAVSCTLDFASRGQIEALAMNSALYNQGVANSAMVSTVFDGVARHTPEGHAFVADARERGFRDAVRRRDEPFGDHGRTTSGV